MINPIVAELPMEDKPKLLDQMRDILRRRHYSIRTEQTYVDWVRRFILFHHKRHPRDLAESEITAFLTSLAREGHVAASTQNQALSALLFLYKEVLKQELGWLDAVERAKRPVRLPVVLAKNEVRKIFSNMLGTHRLMAQLLYGSGLRLMECVRLRVKDVDFAYAHIVVRDGKGAKDRITVLPINLVQPLRRHLLKVKAQHEEDLERAMAVFIYQQHWTGNIRTRLGSGAGNMYFLPIGCRMIRGRKLETVAAPPPSPRLRRARKALSRCDGTMSRKVRYNSR